MGETVIVLAHVDCSKVPAKWMTNREFAVTYPKGVDVEFAVAKTRGVRISLNPE